MQHKTLDWICGFKNTLVDSNGIDKLIVQKAVSGLPKNLPNNDKKIVLVQQFFIHNDPQRHKEILETLTMNVHNDNIDEIHLINERLYTSVEMGTNSKKIHQIVDGGQRLTYRQAMKYAMENIKDSIVVLCNSDIFFDRTIHSCRMIDISNSMICLSRYKLNGINIKAASPETFNGLSQDAWIWDSNTSFSDKELDACDFNLGKPGCDNRIMRLACEMGLKVYNIPNIIKGYHNHGSEIRNYTQADIVQPERYLAMISPLRMSLNMTSFLPANDMQTLCNFHDISGIPYIINAGQEDMVLLRRGFLSLNNPNLNININDVKRFVVQSNFILIDLPFYLQHHQTSNIRIEFALNTQWLNMRERSLDARCFDLCISKRRNFLQYTDKSIIIATSRGNLLRNRIDSGNCRFSNAIELVDVTASKLPDSFNNVVISYTADKIVILDTGADLIFGTLLAKCNIPSIAIGAALNSYFNIIDRAHANKLIDAYEFETDQNWLIV